MQTVHLFHFFTLALTTVYYTRAHGTRLAKSTGPVYVDVEFRRVTLPAGAAGDTNGREVCIDWEPWHTEHNAGRWMGRPGASAIPMVGMYVAPFASRGKDTTVISVIRSTHVFSPLCDTAALIRFSVLSELDADGLGIVL
jgi:hypothetical protein